MTHRPVKRALASVLAGLMILPGIPAQALETQDSQEDILVTLVDGPVSESGLAESIAIDQYGREVAPNLIPDYGDRALNLPASYDLRTYGYSTSVKDQSGTGSCWAHSALASAESNMIVQGLADSSIDLSEAHLVWFGNCRYSTDTADPLYHDGENDGEEGYTSGGNYRIASTALAAGVGVQLESNTPTVNEKPQLAESQRYVSYGRLRDAFVFSAQDKDAIKLMLMENGAVGASYYDGKTSDGYYNKTTYAQYCPTELKTNHAITVIGWDDSFSRTNFLTRPSANGAWLCKNSWGDDWGDSGYFWISYEDKSLAYFTSYQIEAPGTFDELYQYDRSSSRYYSPPDGGFYYLAGANEFTARGDEAVTGVTFQTNSADMPYTIRIYADVDGNPDSGRLVCEQEGTALYAGIHTVYLDEPANITEGSRFSVVVIFRDTTDASAVYFDSQLTGAGDSFLGHYYIAAGKFIQWKDASELTSSDPDVHIGNACIKALTRDGIAINAESFPDAVFRSYVSETFDTDSDGILTDAEIAAARTVNVSGLDVHSLEGIKYFTSMTVLRCSNTPLLFADLPEGQKLTRLASTGCGRSLGAVTCKDIMALDVDVTRIRSITGGYIEDDHIVPTDRIITYVYDTGALLGSTAALLDITLTMDTLSHGTLRYTSDDETSHSVTCADCGDVRSEAHIYGAWSDAADGTHIRSCTVCEAEDSAEHDYGAYTDNGNGTHSRACQTCASKETAKHRFGAYVINKDGTHTRTCLDCGFKETSAHTFGADVDNADGTHTHTCADCGYAVTEAHDFADYTANKDGTHTHVCKDCGAKETFSHVFGADIDNGDGTHTHICADCGFSESEAHDFGDYTANKDGTHTHVCKDCGAKETAAHTFGKYADNGDGTHTHTCTDCGYAVTEEHTLGKYTVDKGGTHSQTCSVCGGKVTSAHNYGKSTDNGNGTHTHICADCSYVAIEVHTFGETYTDTGDGVHHSRACIECGGEELSEHHFGSWTVDTASETRTHTCLECGFAETESTRLMGDINKSGIVTVADVILLQRWLVGNAVTMKDAEAADMDRSGVIDIFDLALLKAKLLAS